MAYGLKLLCLFFFTLQGALSDIETTTTGTTRKSKNVISSCGLSNNFECGNDGTFTCTTDLLIAELGFSVSESWNMLAPNVNASATNTSCSLDGKFCMQVSEDRHQANWIVQKSQFQDEKKYDLSMKFENGQKTKLSTELNIYGFCKPKVSLRNGMLTCTTEGESGDYVVLWTYRNKDDEQNKKSVSGSGRLESSLYLNVKDPKEIANVCCTVTDTSYINKQAKTTCLDYDLATIQDWRPPTASHPKVWATVCMFLDPQCGDNLIFTCKSDSVITGAEVVKENQEVLLQSAKLLDGKSSCSEDGRFCLQVKEEGRELSLSASSVTFEDQMPYQMWLTYLDGVKELHHFHPSVEGICKPTISREDGRIKCEALVRSWGNGFTVDWTDHHGSFRTETTTPKVGIRTLESSILPGSRKTSKICCSISVGRFGKRFERKACLESGEQKTQGNEHVGSSADGGTVGRITIISTSCLATIVAAVTALVMFL